MKPVIYFYVPSFSHAIGGAEVQATNLAKAVAATDKFAVKIISKYGVFNEVKDKFFCSKLFKSFNRQPWMGHIYHIFQVMRYLRLERDKPKVVHFHSVSQMSIFLGCLLLFFSIGQDNCTIVYKVTRTGKSAPIVSNLRRPLYKLCFSLHKAFNTRFIVLTETGHAELVKLGVDSDNLALIPNGVDLFVWGNKVEWPVRKNIYLVVGRLIHRKNVVEIIRAWSKSSSSEDRQLLIVGDGPEACALKKIAAVSKNASQIRFLGLQDQKQVRELAKQARFYISSSIGEGLSNSLIEAMASGLIPIVKKIPENAAVVDDTIDGFLFSSNDDLTSLLALKFENANGAQLSRSARKKVETHFCLESVVDNYIGFVSSLMALKQKPAKSA